MRSLSLITTLLLGATMLLGQERPQRPNADALKNLLELTDQQMEDLQTLRKEQREAMRTTMQETRQKHVQLRQELQQESPNPNVVGQLTLEIQNMRNAVKDTSVEYREKALNFLTDQQKTTLTSLEQAQSLLPAIQQATRMNLLEGGGGPGFGRRGGHGGYKGRGGRFGGLRGQGFRPPAPSQ